MYSGGTEFTDEFGVPISSGLRNGYSTALSHGSGDEAMALRKLVHQLQQEKEQLLLSLQEKEGRSKGSLSSISTLKEELESKVNQFRSLEFKAKQLELSLEATKSALEESKVTKAEVSRYKTKIATLERKLKEAQKDKPSRRKSRRAASVMNEEEGEEKEEEEEEEEAAEDKNKQQSSPPEPQESTQTKSSSNLTDSWDDIEWDAESNASGGEMEDVKEDENGLNEGMRENISPQDELSSKSMATAEKDITKEPHQEEQAKSQHQEESGSLDSSSGKAKLEGGLTADERAATVRLIQATRLAISQKSEELKREKLRFEQAKQLSEELNARLKLAAKALIEAKDKIKFNSAWKKNVSSVIGALSGNSSMSTVNRLQKRFLSKSLDYMRPGSKSKDVEEDLRSEHDFEEGAESTDIEPYVVDPSALIDEMQMSADNEPENSIVQLSFAKFDELLKEVVEQRNSTEMVEQTKVKVPKLIRSRVYNTVSSMVKKLTAVDDAFSDSLNEVISWESEPATDEDEAVGAFKLFDGHDDALENTDSFTLQEHVTRLIVHLALSMGKSSINAKGSQGSQPLGVSDSLSVKAGQLAFRVALGLYSKSCSMDSIVISLVCPVLYMSDVQSGDVLRGFLYFTGLLASQLESVWLEGKSSLMNGFVNALHCALAVATESIQRYDTSQQLFETEERSVSLRYILRKFLGDEEDPMVSVDLVKRISSITFSIARQLNARLPALLAIVNSLKVLCVPNPHSVASSVCRVEENGFVVYQTTFESMVMSTAIEIWPELFDTPTKALSRIESTLSRFDERSCTDSIVVQEIDRLSQSPEDARGKIGDLFEESEHCAITAIVLTTVWRIRGSGMRIKVMPTTIAKLLKLYENLNSRAIPGIDALATSIFLLEFGSHINALLETAYFSQSALRLLVLQLKPDWVSVILTYFSLRPLKSLFQTPEVTTIQSSQLLGIQIVPSLVLPSLSLVANFLSSQSGPRKTDLVVSNLPSIMVWRVMMEPQPFTLLASLLSGMLCKLHLALSIQAQIASALAQIIPWSSFVQFSSPDNDQKSDVEIGRKRKRFSLSNQNVEGVAKPTDFSSIMFKILPSDWRSAIVVLLRWWCGMQSVLHRAQNDDVDCTEVVKTLHEASLCVNNDSGIQLTSLSEVLNLAVCQLGALILEDDE